MVSDTCRHCNGSGEIERFPNAPLMVCSFCGGSGLSKEPKFRATCECGVRQPRATTAWTANKWMKEHLKTHRPKVHAHA